MLKETYQEIKKISGEELKELLSTLNNVFSLSTFTLKEEELSSDSNRL